MEEKKNKISLSVFISVLAVLVIIIMAGFIYMQKVNADREIAGLKGDAENLKVTVSELQGKLDANTTEETNKDIKNKENNTQDNDTSFTYDEVNAALMNYWTLRITMGDEILEKLTQRGFLDYNRSENIETENGSNSENTITMKVKFSNYKNAMLNYVSEEEFKRTFKDKFGVDKDEYLTYQTGLGGPDLYCVVMNITKRDDKTYIAKTFSTEPMVEESAEFEDYTFTVKNYNGRCVIDSISKI